MFRSSFRQVARAFHTVPPALASGLEHARMTVEKTTSPRQRQEDKLKLGFGQIFSDHMLEADWSREAGWEPPRIKPFENLSLPPSTLVFHYALECFEGMKCYKGIDGGIRLFRPDLNIARFNRSCDRLALPTVDADEFQQCLEDLVRLDADWIPEGRGYSMYLRPTMIATQETLGVSPTSHAKMFVITSPVGAYYAGGFKPIRLLADTNYVRAWPGGVGDTKCGGNYAPTIYPQQQAMAAGYDQILWLYGEEMQVTEAGTMNFFVRWTNKEGKEELVTAPLDGTILPGVTRQALLDLCREWGEFDVTERVYTMDELVEAIEDGRVKEMFGSGTAATISPVKEIVYNGKALASPVGEDAGPLAQRLTDAIFDIQYGVVDHDWAPKIA